MNGRIFPDKVDRRLAALCHVLAVVGPLWLPFAASLVLRPVSTYACRHALRAALDNVWLEASILGLMLFSAIWTTVQYMQTISSGFKFDPWMALTHVLVVFGLWVFLQAWNLVLAVVWMIKALNGQDPPMHKWVERLAPRRDELAQTS